MRGLLLACLLLSVPASAKIDGYPRTAPEGCGPGIQKAVLIEPSDDAKPPNLPVYISFGYEIKTTFTDNGRLFVVVQKEGRSAWCDTTITDEGVRSKPCHIVGRNESYP